MNELNANMIKPNTAASHSASSASASVKRNANHAYANESGKTLPPSATQKVDLAEVTEEKVQEAVSKLNDYVQSQSRTLNFQVDDESGETVIRVYDQSSEKLIRQIPNELALELARKLNEDEPSLLFNAQV